MIQEATLSQSQQIPLQQQHQENPSHHHHHHHHHHHQHRQPSKRKRLKSTPLTNDDANTSGNQCYSGVASGWPNVDQNVRHLASSSSAALASASASASASATATTTPSSACFDGGSRFSNGFPISNDIASSTAHTSMNNNMDNNGMNDIGEDISTMQTRNRSGLITTTTTPNTTPTINSAMVDDDNEGDIFDAPMMPAYHPIGIPSLSYQHSVIMNQMDMVANASSVDVVNNFGINHRLNHNTDSFNNNHNQHHICPHQQQPLVPQTITTDTLATTGSTVSITNASVAAAAASASSSSSPTLDNLAQSLTVDNHHHPNSFHQHSPIRPLPPQQQQFFSNGGGGGGNGGALVSNGSETSSTSVTNIEKLCFGCRQTLSTSPIIATVSGYHNWHIHCLCCSECGQSLSQSRSCYGRNGRIYCKDDYIKSIKCCKCNRSISSTDWVRRAGTLVYHLACFACDICQRQLSTGEKFTIENLSNTTTNNNTIGYQHHPNRSNCKNDVRHSMMHNANANNTPTTALANSNQNNYHHHHNKNSANNSGTSNYRLVCKLHFGIKDEDVAEATVLAQSSSRALDLDPVPSIENGRLANETLGHRIHQPEDSLMIETNGGSGVDGNSGPEGNPFSTNPSNNNATGVATIDPSTVTSQNSNLSNCGRNSSLSNSTTGTSTIQSATTPPSTTNSGCGSAGSGVGIGGNSKTKRVRTTFTEEQLSILQANFQIDSNPDGQDLERIAALTGLSKRVTQVWFQNSRARQKKFMSKSSSSSSSAHHHHHHHHHHHQPQSQQQRNPLMDDGSHPQAQVSLLINGQQPALNRATNSGCGVALWSPGTTTSNSSSSSSSSSNGVGGNSGNNGIQDNQPTPSESIMLLDSHTNPHHSHHHQHHRHHPMAMVKNMAWNNPGSSTSTTMTSMNETSKLNNTNESSELPPMTSNGSSSNKDGSIVGSL